MSTPPSRPAKPPATSGRESAVLAFAIALGTYFGVWLGPLIHEWKHEGIPDPYGAIAGMGIGFFLGSIANGFIAGMREGRGRK